MIKIKIKNKNRIIKTIHHRDEKRLDAHYYGWHIHIYPMFGKLIGGRYRDDLETGEFGVDVSAPDGGRIVDAVAGSFEKALIEAMENILLCRPRYERQSFFL